MLRESATTKPKNTREREGGGGTHAEHMEDLAFFKLTQGVRAFGVEACSSTRQLVDVGNVNVCQHKELAVNINTPTPSHNILFGFEEEDSPFLPVSSAPPPRPRPPPPSPPEAAPGCVGAVLSAAADTTPPRPRHEPPTEPYPVSARPAGTEELSPLATPLALASPAPPAVLLFERGGFRSSPEGGAIDSIRSRSTRLSAQLRAAAEGRCGGCDSPNGSLSDVDIPLYLLAAWRCRSSSAHGAQLQEERGVGGLETFFCTCFFLFWYDTAPDVMANQ